MGPRIVWVLDDLYGRSWSKRPLVPVLADLKIPPNWRRLHCRRSSFTNRIIAQVRLESRIEEDAKTGGVGVAADVIQILGQKGATPSQIGVVLRDSHGVAQVKVVTGNKILRILKSSGLAPEIPEDLYFLIRKAVSVRKHLERNRKDRDSKFRLILIESRIHRLSRYYKTVGVLPPTWKYESATASTLVA
ncbi:ribosomal 40S subunit protein S13 [Diplodia intermedia]|uniref:Ribosomal 40S subunit protein S13 n=1 Tax=Diplodia intermedia TaxID=856260 RepID=A0ABR3TS36_9PEZI